MKGAKRYLPTDHAEMSRWYEMRGIAPPAPDMLPHIGFIVPGVGAGFLYRTDSSIGLIDGLISNPEAASHLRRDALLEIGALLKASFAGRVLLVYTDMPGIARWSREHDFAARDTPKQLFAYVKEA